MIDDLIFFGINHTIPEEKGIAFLFRMFKAYGRNIQRLLEPLKSITQNTGKGKIYTCGGEIPAHLRKNKNRRKKEK